MAEWRRGVEVAGVSRLMRIVSRFVPRSLVYWCVVRASVEASHAEAASKGRGAPLPPGRISKFTVAELLAVQKGGR